MLSVLLMPLNSLLSHSCFFDANVEQVEGLKRLGIAPLLRIACAQME